MATVVLPLSFFKTGDNGNRDEVVDPKPPRDTFFQRKHHCTSSYSRIENWLPDVVEHSFLTEMVPLSQRQAHAILKYRDETKLRASIRDDTHQEASDKAKGEYFTPALEDPLFLNEMFDFIMSDWPRDSQQEVRDWHANLSELQTALDATVRRVDKGHGTFVKLSIRSPKDSSLNMAKTHEGIRRRTRESALSLVNRKPTPETVNEDIIILKEACGESLRVRDGEHALRLFLESDRVNTDLMSQMLYLEDGEQFNVSIAVREWCPVVDPDWEFRLFIMANQPTALTIYNDFFYEQRIVEHKTVIETMILETWRRVCDRIHQHTSSYCIDFAVTPDLQSVFVIEVNNFLPPLAGTGLFSCCSETDRKLLNEGPFTFRVREAPLCDHEQTVEGHGVRTLHPPLLRLMECERLRKDAEERKLRCVVS